MEIRKSSIVRSVAGPDSGGLYFVLETDGVYADIVNGKTRRIEKPKRKKLKHLRYESQGCGTAGEKLRCGEAVTNKEIRRGLAEYTAYPAEKMEVCKNG